MTRGFFCADLKNQFEFDFNVPFCHGHAPWVSSSSTNRKQIQYQTTPRFTVI